MTVRSGMTNPILRLRAMTETSIADYSVGGLAYWTDDQLQDVLDRNVDVVRLQALQPEAEYASGATIWKDYPTGIDCPEAVASAAPFWSLTDSTGTEVTSSLYALDQNTGIVRFTADQNAAIYFLTARSYRLADAAADVWRQKAAHAYILVDFSAEGQSFSQSQWFDHCTAMAQQYQRQGGFKVVNMWRSDLA